ncbi:hypothetical protein SAMN05428984_2996 [Sphingomonas sp. OK281]|nr:hypothetical protein SAMN05428984_2996 [Sphingomonas sp. OK281]
MGSRLRGNDGWGWNDGWGGNAEPSSRRLQYANFRPGRVHRVFTSRPLPEQVM